MSYPYSGGGGGQQIQRGWYLAEDDQLYQYPSYASGQGGYGGYQQSPSGLYPAYQASSQSVYGQQSPQQTPGGSNTAAPAQSYQTSSQSTYGQQSPQQSSSGMYRASDGRPYARSSQDPPCVLESKCFSGQKRSEDTKLFSRKRPTRSMARNVIPLGMQLNVWKPCIKRPRRRKQNVADISYWSFNDWNPQSGHICQEVNRSGKMCDPCYEHRGSYPNFADKFKNAAQVIGFPGVWEDPWYDKVEVAEEHAMKTMEKRPFASHVEYLGGRNYYSDYDPHSTENLIESKLRPSDHRPQYQEANGMKMWDDAKIPLRSGNFDHDGNYDKRKEAECKKREEEDREREYGERRRR
ncbi:hypothetical protein BU23DRAFT_595903 [Bimuria novae-zelandiae CBS 107.79]|uniref:Uncharacterized protein n=1 Tax=Bimuria novae-zelandiae CBS 107.79 TaxID=1447943 RepID=A0A6A5VNL9_9PLEO|nr:hypothetical protein BU23DRAFT_595903 [Bimuria novae-zelandiae CBS 107.79]